MAFIVDRLMNIPRNRIRCEFVSKYNVKSDCIILVIEDLILYVMRT